MRCPRCPARLVSSRLGGREVRACEECTGVLVSIPDLRAVLDEVAAGLSGQVDADAEIEPVADPGAGLSCPDCAATMANEGYLGTELVRFDRCDRCAHLWIDGGELGVMALLRARTEQRGQRRQKLYDEQLEQTGRLVDRIQVTRALSRMLFRGLT